MDNPCSEQKNSTDSSPQGGGEGVNGTFLSMPRVQRKITNLENQEGGSIRGWSKKDDLEMAKFAMNITHMISGKFSKKWVDVGVIDYSECFSYSGEYLAKNWDKFKEMYQRDPVELHKYLNKVLPLKLITLLRERLKTAVAEQTPDFTVDSILRQLKDPSSSLWKTVEAECSDDVFQALKFQYMNDISLTETCHILKLSYYKISKKRSRELEKIGFTRLGSLSAGSNI